MMYQSSTTSIAIIGGSIAGLTLALSLQQQNISCEVYESRDRSYQHGGAVMLAPNSLRVLDHLGAYANLRQRGFNFQAIHFMNQFDDKVGEWWFGDEQIYGYNGLRIYRSVILEELRRLVDERQIPIHYNARYSRVISDSKQDGVIFELTDSSHHQADFLVGADGIHSKVRTNVTKTLPEYGGFIAITFPCDTKHLRVPKKADYQLPVSIAGDKGVYIVAPQKNDESECLVGTQLAHPEQTREGWKKMLEDTDSLEKRLLADYESWGDLPKSALEHIKKEEINVWPFYRVPPLKRWTSNSGRIFIIGDAAHAIPPTIGQGANQAFEDGYALALIFAGIKPFGGPADVPIDHALAFWQSYREKRVADVWKLTIQMNNRRLPAAERAKLSKEEVFNDDKMKEQGAGILNWLYNPKINESVATWLDSQSKI